MSAAFRTPSEPYVKKQTNPGTGVCGAGVGGGGRFDKKTILVTRRGNDGAEVRTHHGEGSWFKSLFLPGPLCVGEMQIRVG